MTRNQDFSEEPLPGSLVMCTALIVIFWMSCVGTEVGNPQTSGTDNSGPSEPERTLSPIDFDAYEHTERGALTLESGITFEQAWLHVESIEFQRASPDADADSVREVVGPFAVELISGQELPATPVLIHDGERFERVRLNIRTPEVVAEDDRGAVEGAPEELLDASLFATGTYKDGRTFTIKAEIDAAHILTTSDEAGFILDDESNPFIAVAINNLLEDVLLDRFLREERDGSVVIDGRNNRLFRAKIERTFTDSISLFDDTNSDGEIDLGEDASLAKGTPESSPESSRPWWSWDDDDDDDDDDD